MCQMEIFTKPSTHERCWWWPTFEEEKIANRNDIFISSFFFKCKHLQSAKHLFFSSGTLFFSPSQKSSLCLSRALRRMWNWSLARFDYSCVNQPRAQLLSRRLRSALGFDSVPTWLLAAHRIEAAIELGTSEFWSTSRSRACGFLRFRVHCTVTGIASQSHVNF